MARAFQYTATAAFGAEDALVRELRSIGIHRATAGKGHVRFQGGLDAGYRACLWSRVASRVFLTIGRFEATTADELYQGLDTIDWSNHIQDQGTLWIDFVGRSKQIRDERFGAQRCKDAICDQLRNRTGQRPSISPRSPDLRLRVHMRDGLVTASVDLSGEALHRRSAGRATGPAPLRETLAAAVLWYADWPKRARGSATLQDPMCGSGTFLLEAAGMALDVAPGLQRTAWGFDRWIGHDRKAWNAVRTEAEQRREAGAENASRIQLFGSDEDDRVVQSARGNIDATGWKDLIRIEHCPLAQARPKAASSGLVVVNPPYGQRLSAPDQAQAIHTQLGDILRHHFLGWTVGILTEHPLVGSIGLRPHRRIPIRNGSLDCRVVLFEIAQTAPMPASS